MRRSPFVAVAVAVAFAGCGSQQEHPREPLGQGETQRPEPPVRAVQELRVTEVHIRDGRFDPAAISVRVDNSITLVNEDERTYQLKTEGSAAPPGSVASAEEPIAPGETVERTFTVIGTAVVETGAGEKLTVQVFQ